MAHHEAGREVVADGEAAEHGLADDAERQQHAEPREVAAERPAPPGERARGDRGEADEARRSARLPYSIQACVSSGGATPP